MWTAKVLLVLLAAAEVAVGAPQIYSALPLAPLALANHGPIATVAHAPYATIAHAPYTPVAAAVHANEEPYDPHPQYSFSYDVQDPTTGDFKSHSESRDGDVVHGSYSLIEADGSRRVVEYNADPVNGFNAVVHKEPGAAPPAPIRAPVALAHAPLLPHAPIATVAHAPITTVSHASLASPHISYAF